VPQRISRPVLEGLLALAAVALQASHETFSYDAGFMYVDPVGIPSVLACLLLGFRASMRVLLATVAAIVLLDPSGVIGALLKLAATLPVVLALQRPSAAATAGFVALGAFLLSGGTNWLARLLGSGWSMAVGLAAVAAPILAAGVTWWQRPPTTDIFGSWRLPLAIALAILARGCLMVFADLYFAVPVFFGQTLLEAVAGTPAHVVMGWNGVQAVVDVLGAGLLAMAWRRHGLDTRYTSLHEHEHQGSPGG